MITAISYPIFRLEESLGERKEDNKIPKQKKSDARHDARIPTFLEIKITPIKRALHQYSYLTPLPAIVPQPLPVSPTMDTRLPPHTWD